MLEAVTTLLCFVILCYVMGIIDCVFPVLLRCDGCSIWCVLYRVLLKMILLCGVGMISYVCDILWPVEENYLCSLVTIPRQAKFHSPHPTLHRISTSFGTTHSSRHDQFNGVLTIGNQQSQTSGSFNARALAVWHRVLGATEVEQIYNAGR